MSEQPEGLAEAFQFTVELDRNTPRYEMTALDSDAVSAASDLNSNCGHGRP